MGIKNTKSRKQHVTSEKLLAYLVLRSIKNFTLLKPVPFSISIRHPNYTRTALRMWVKNENSGLKRTHLFGMEG